MKNKLILLTVIIALFAGCRSETDVIPVDTWSKSCIQLAPYQDGYRLTGMCCAYAQVPRVTLVKNGVFSVNGTYHSFTGAGFDSTPMQFMGYLSPDGKLLTIRYTVNANSVTIVLSPGAATVLCYCGCD